MGVGRCYRKKPVRRPKKDNTERKRRQMLHRKRLIALGVPAEQLARMDPVQIRRLLAEKLKK